MQFLSSLALIQVVISDGALWRSDSVFPRWKLSQMVAHPTCHGDHQSSDRRWGCDVLQDRPHKYHSSNFTTLRFHNLRLTDNTYRWKIKIDHIFRIKISSWTIDSTHTLSFWNFPCDMWRVQAACASFKTCLNGYMTIGLHIFARQVCLQTYTAVTRCLILYLNMSLPNSFGTWLLKSTQHWIWIWVIITGYRSQVSRCDALMGLETIYCLHH